MPTLDFHFYFLEANHDLNTAIQGQYDPVLVLLSILVACLAAYTAFLLTERFNSSHSFWQRMAWVTAAAFSLGSGIWSMHFTGMLAFQLPMPIQYDKLITMLSMLPALLASGIVLSVRPGQRQYRFLCPVQSILMGCGIGSMHYAGMAAMHIEASMRFDPGIFILSIIVAIVLSFVSLRLKLWAESMKQRAIPKVKALIVAAVVMGCAVSAMHYIGMAAAYYFPVTEDVIHHSHPETVWLAESVANLTIYIVLGIMLLMLSAVHFSRRLELLEQLRHSEMRQRNIVDNMVDGLIVINDTGFIESFNSAAEKIFGYRADEVIGQNVTVLMDMNEQSQHDEHMARYKDSAKSRVIGIGREIEGRRKDGSTFPVDIALSTMEIEGRQLFAGVVRDITERKEAEERILHAKQVAEKANEAKSDFLMRVSHELRTPMNAILGFGQLLEMESGSFSKEQQNYIKELQHAGHRLLELINDVLDLSELGSNTLNISLETVLLRDVVKSCLSEVQPLAEKRHIEIIDQISGKDAMVKADNIRLRQVICNLLSNSVKHNHEHGRVTLSCSPIGNDRLRISVMDTGSGLTPEQQEQLFTPFGRLNKDESRSGTGIGLAISKHLTELMGGSIGVDTTLGQGSTFWIELETAMNT